MKNSQDTDLANSDGEEVTIFEPEGSTYIEKLLRALIINYEEGYNRANEKNEITFQLTITNHKMSTEEGNKDIAYLRLDRGIRPKIDAEGKPWPDDKEGWSVMLVHQDMYYFKNMKERVNPKAPWKDQLYMQAISKIFGGGLEYAEFLRRAKQIEDNQKKVEKTAEERLHDMGLVSADEMPKPLTEDEVKYKEWLTAERAKEGL